MKILMILAAIVPSAGFAHPDHAHEQLTLWHALTEPDHAAMIAVALAVVVTVVMKSRRSRRDAARTQTKKTDKLK